MTAIAAHLESIRIVSWPIQAGRSFLPWRQLTTDPAPHPRASPSTSTTSKRRFEPDVHDSCIPESGPAGSVFDMSKSCSVQYDSPPMRMVGSSPAAAGECGLTAIPPSVSFRGSSLSDAHQPETHHAQFSESPLLARPAPPGIALHRPKVFFPPIPKHRAPRAGIFRCISCTRAPQRIHFVKRHTRKHHTHHVQHRADLSARSGRATA